MLVSELRLQLYSYSSRDPRLQPQPCPGVFFHVPCAALYPERYDSILRNLILPTSDIIITSPSVL